MMIKKILCSILLVLSLFVYSWSYEVDLPWPTQNIHSTSNISMSSSDDPYYMSLFKVINKYLWFFTGVVSFILVLTAGYRLVTSKWKAEDLKKANKMLVWGLVGIFVSLLSYAIVKVLINLF